MTKTIYNIISYNITSNSTYFSKDYMLITFHEYLTVSKTIAPLIFYVDFHSLEILENEYTLDLLISINGLKISNNTLIIFIQILYRYKII